MKQAEVYCHNELAGLLVELEPTKAYRFVYKPEYRGDPISLTMPVRDIPYEFDTFPPFFDGLLPEGMQLDGLLRLKKIDRYDFFSQLLCVGADLVGAVTVREHKA